MKHLILLYVTILLVSRIASPQDTTKADRKPADDDKSVLVYSGGTGFWLDPPSAWVVDQEVGKRHGICWVFYPKGSTWNDAETVMYPRAAAKGPAQATLRELMDADLAEFRQHSPQMTYKDGSDVPLSKDRVAKVRYLYGVNHGGSEAVAYIDEDRIIALLVVSSKTTQALEKSFSTFRKTLESYSCCMAVHSTTGDLAPAPKP